MDSLNCFLSLEFYPSENTLLFSNISQKQNVKNVFSDENIDFWVSI